VRVPLRPRWLGCLRCVLEMKCCVLSLAQKTITVYIWLSRTSPWHEEHRNKVREWLFAEQEQTEATSQLLSFVKEQKERERQLSGGRGTHTRNQRAAAPAQASV